MIAPTRASAEARSSGTSRPRTRRLPAVGFARPSSSRISVVLPAPLAPRKPKATPRETTRSTPSSAAREPKDLPRPRDSIAGDCECRREEEFMTTILAVNGFAHIGRRSELGPGDGMMFRRRLIRSDEAWLGRSPSARPWAVSASAHYQRATGERSDRAVGDERFAGGDPLRAQGPLRVRRLAAGLQTTGCARGTGSLVARSSG